MGKLFSKRGINAARGIREISHHWEQPKHKKQKEAEHPVHALPVDLPKHMHLERSSLMDKINLRLKWSGYK